MAGVEAHPEDRSPERLDLRGTPCPLNFVRAKLKLQKMPQGALLEIWLDLGEPMAQVPDGLTMAGYRIEALETRQDYGVLQVRSPLSELSSP